MRDILAAVGVILIIGLVLGMFEASRLDRGIDLGDGPHTFSWYEKKSIVVYPSEPSVTYVTPAAANDQGYQPYDAANQDFAGHHVITDMVTYQHEDQRISN